jgi:hypothetical protein
MSISHEAVCTWIYAQPKGELGVHSRGLGSDILDTPAWQQCLQF